MPMTTPCQNPSNPAASSTMSYLSDFEHTKLDAHVFPGCVVQKHYISSASSGQRRVPVTKVWKVEKLLGKGTFGEVRLEACSLENKNTNEERAVKRIWTTGTEFKRSYERELKALLEFSKPKYKESAVFVEFLGWFEDVESVYLAMEYLPMGDLEDNVLSVGGSIKETEAREIAVQVLEGLKIMHLENFAHRDLKPKNVLVCQGPPNWWVKLADFGLSKRQTDETGFRTQAGTSAYMAPEILNYIPGVDPETSEYTNAVDMWALGCIVYRLVCGVVPFPPGPSLVKFSVNESEFPPKVEEFTGLGQTFVKSLIVPYPSRRLTAQQALEHLWTRSGLETSNFESHSISFGGYATETHVGLQSHKLAAPTPVVDSGAAERGVPKTYHSPTVEDEQEDTGSDTGSVSAKIEEPESTMRPRPTKPKSSKTSQDNRSNWEKPRRRSDEPSTDPYNKIVELLDPPPTASKKPSVQTYASQPSTPPSRQKPSRPELPGHNPYIIELPSPLSSVQIFAGDQVQPLPSALTFQAKDHEGSRLRREYISSKSDSDPDTSVYTDHHNLKPSPALIKIQPEDLAKRLGLPLRLKRAPEPPEPTIYRAAASRPHLRHSSAKPLSYEEKLAAAASYNRGINELRNALTQENLAKHAQTPRDRPSKPTTGPPSDASYDSDYIHTWTAHVARTAYVEEQDVVKPSTLTTGSPSDAPYGSGYIDTWTAHVARTAYVEE